jgi:hypothetical protein
MMSYFNCTKSNIIIRDSDGEIENTYPIRDANIVMEIIEDIMLRDCFKIKGIGMLGIKTIGIRQFDSTINFNCYRIDTTEYY